MAESVYKIETVLSINFMIVSLPWRSLNARASCLRSVVKDSTEWEFLSCMASGCSTNITPVVSWYACRADSKRALKRVDAGWLLISQVGSKCGLKEGSCQWLGVEER